MQLIVYTPTERVFDGPAAAVIAPTAAGSWCVLPHRLDMTTSLTRGVLVVRDADDAERYVAVDEGTLVKVGDIVSVATARAVCGDDLLTLHDTIEQRFAAATDDARAAAGALARCEITIVRRLRELERGTHDRP